MIRLLIEDVTLVKGGLKSRYDRLREVGYLTDEELAKLLGVSPKTVAERRKRGLLLYERPMVSVNGGKVSRFAKD